MNQYEVMYVIDTALEEGPRSELVARFSDLVVKGGGEVERVDEWGKRRLAYAINYKTEGYYVLMYIKGPSDLPRELERNLQISDSVLRYLVIRFEGALPAKREPLRPFIPANQAHAAAPSDADAVGRDAAGAPSPEPAPGTDAVGRDALGAPSSEVAEEIAEAIQPE